MVENKAIEGVVSRVELADMRGQENGDFDSVNEYRECYHASYTGPFVRHIGAGPREEAKYFNHNDIGVSVFTSREDLIKTI